MTIYKTTRNNHSCIRHNRFQMFEILLLFLYVKLRSLCHCVFPLVFLFTCQYTSIVSKRNTIHTLYCVLNSKFKVVWIMKQRKVRSAVDKCSFYTLKFFSFSFKSKLCSYFVFSAESVTYSMKVPLKVDKSCIPLFTVSTENVQFMWQINYIFSVLTVWQWIFWEWSMKEIVIAERSVTAARDVFS